MHRRSYEFMLQYVIDSILGFTVEEAADELEEMVEAGHVSREIENGTVVYFLTEENVKACFEAYA